MAEAAILKNPKIAISRQCFERAERNLARLLKLALRTGPNFYTSNMTDGRHLKNPIMAIYR